MIRSPLKLPLIKMGLEIVYLVINLRFTEVITTSRITYAWLTNNIGIITKNWWLNNIKKKLRSHENYSKEYQREAK